MRLPRIIFAMLFTLGETTSFAQRPAANPNSKISLISFRTLAQSCAATVPVSTLEAIALAESALYPYALSINRPHQLAHRLGWHRGIISLERQPASREEAVAWTKWLFSQGVTVSIGLLQVNSEQAALLHITPEQLFDPCTNLSSGAALLSADYAAAARTKGEGFAALDSALSYYNTGSPTAGLTSGYVQQVKTHAKRSEDQP